MSVEIVPEPFDPHAALAAFEQRQGGDVGAVSSLIGRLRADDGVTAMTLEHYPGMTEKEIGRIVREARSRWGLFDALVVHRVGRVQVGDPIVLVATASGHRAAALEAVAFIIDYLKTRAPFWKKEQHGATARWVEARAADDQAAERWK